MAPFGAPENIPCRLIRLAIFALDRGDCDLCVQRRSRNRSSLDIDAWHLRAVVGDFNTGPFPRLRRHMPPNFSRESHHTPAAGKLVALCVCRGLYRHTDWRCIAPLPQNFSSRSAFNFPLPISIPRHALDGARASNHRPVDVLDLSIAKLDSEWRTVVHLGHARGRGTQLTNGSTQSHAGHLPRSHISKPAPDKHNIVEGHGVYAFAQMIGLTGLNRRAIRWQLGTFQY
mmetsp:Transcript_53099/g.116515  ORF Transcript_53099/g.116515 Transcript_53099/m.116515 type:complete len:229 (-) Transcript_53099:2226-2912(-)